MAINIDKDNLENIDIDKDYLENIDIDIDIDKEILENIYINIDIGRDIRVKNRFFSKFKTFFMKNQHRLSIYRHFFKYRHLL